MTVTPRMQPLRETMRSLRASPVFAIFVLVTLVVVGLIGLMTGLMALRLNFLLPGPFAHMAHFTEASHRVHDLTYGFVFVPGVVGILAQLRRPSKNVAGMLMALIPWVGLLLAAVLSATPFVFLSAQSLLPAVLTMFTALLHPSTRDFFRSFSLSRANWVMLALVAIAAVPLLVFVSTNIGLQRTVSDDHADMGHYGFMAAFGFTVIGVGLLASLRPAGSKLAAWIAGLLAALIGLTSVIYPDVMSSLSMVWALAAIASSVSFVAAAVLTKDKEFAIGRPAPYPDTNNGGTPMTDLPPYPEDNSRSRDEIGVGSTTSASRGWKVIGLIVLVLVVLFVVMHLLGGAPRPH